MSENQSSAELVSNQETQNALDKASVEVGKYITDATVKVAELKNKYGSIVPSNETPEDYDFCKQVRRDLQPVAKGLEDARKTLKQPVLEMSRLIDGSIKPLIDEVKAIYKPFVDCYQELDNRAKRLREEREAKINAAFERMNNMAVEALGQNAVVIETIIDELADFDFAPEVFQERTDEAVKLHSDLMGRLKTMLDAQIAQEELQKRNAEVERKEREQHEREEAERKQAERENIEREAVERAEREKAEQEKLRAADLEHKRSVHADILAKMVEGGVPEEHAKKAIELIAKGLAGSARIIY